MTPQEHDVLMPLLDKIQHTEVGAKDAEADQAIQRMAAAQPDALYILAQSVLMLDYSLHQAKDRIEALEAAQRSQPAQGQGGGSFLGSLFGNHSSAPSQQVPQQSGSPWGQRPATPPSYAQPINTAMQAGAFQPSGQPSFLGSAARTAAGIVGGALLFQGMEGLLGGHGGFGGGFGGGGFGNAGFGGGYGGQQPVVEETVNNYYDQAAPDSSVPDSNVGVQGGDSSDYTDASDTGIDTSGDDSFNI